MTTNIQELRELKLFIEGGSLKVALFGRPSSANDHWICNLPFDQVFSRYPNTLPMEQRIKASTANNQVTMLENLADCIADGDPTTEDLSLDDDSMTSQTTDKLIDEGEADDSEPTEINHQATAQQLRRSIKAASRLAQAAKDANNQGQQARWLAYAAAASLQLPAMIDDPQKVAKYRSAAMKRLRLSFKAASGMAKAEAEAGNHQQQASWLTSAAAASLQLLNLVEEPKKAAKIRSVANKSLRRASKALSQIAKSSSNSNKNG